MWDTTTRTVVKDIKCKYIVRHLIEDEGVVYAAVDRSALTALDGMTGDIIASYAKAEGCVVGFSLHDGLFVLLWIKFAAELTIAVVIGIVNFISNITIRSVS